MIPIIRGGQGRDARAVEESAQALAVYLILGAVAIVLLALYAGGR